MAAQIQWGSTSEAPGGTVQNCACATWRKVGELLDLFSNEECANYLKNSGYVSV